MGNGIALKKTRQDLGLWGGDPTDRNCRGPVGRAVGAVTGGGLSWAMLYFGLCFHCLSRKVFGEKRVSGPWVGPIIKFAYERKIQGSIAGDVSVCIFF